jgi:hypothetical protein
MSRMQADIRRRMSGSIGESTQVVGGLWRSLDAIPKGLGNFRQVSSFIVG